MGCWALGIPQPDAAPSQVLSAWETKKCFIGKCICTASVNINRIHTLDIRVSLHLLPTLYSQWHWITGGWVIPGGFCSVGQSKPELDVRCFLASHCVCVCGRKYSVCVCVLNCIQFLSGVTFIVFTFYVPTKRQAFKRLLCSKSIFIL